MVTIEVHQNTTTLASVTIPDTALTPIQTALGGGTAAQTAAAFLALVVKQMKPAIRQLILAQQDAAAGATADAATAATTATFAGNWP